MADDGKDLHILLVNIKLCLPKKLKIEYIIC